MAAVDYSGPNFSGGIALVDIPELGPVSRGKVRDCWRLGAEKRVMVTTDRQCAFVRPVCTVPGKGQISNRISRFWFDKTSDIIPNHCLSLPHPNVIVARQASLKVNGKCPRGTVELLDTATFTGPQGPAGAAGVAGQNGAAGPAGEAGPAGPQGASGANGLDGAAGADGALRIYGDGSAGNFEVNVPTAFGAVDTNFQYENCTIGAGGSLYVPSGSIIRCSGSFTNAGTIVVQSGEPGSSLEGNLEGTISALAVRPGGSGVSRIPGGSAEAGDATAIRYGGLQGNPLPNAAAASMGYPGLTGGGGGGASLNATGGSGGGSFVVLARGPITNSGTISANVSNGSNGSGGGGGGVIKLGSLTSITNSGTIAANGGNGGNGTVSNAPGSGGGGGIIHLIAPQISVGTTSTVAGSRGTNTPITATIRAGGGGGGASGGAGGVGSDVPVGSPATPYVGGAGPQAGYTTQTVANPSALF